MSQDQRKKLSDSCKGRKMSEETKQKISNTTKGKTLTEDHRNKIGTSNKGKSRQTEEGLERLKKNATRKKGETGKKTF